MTDERRKVSSPDALKALAHPLRLRILRHLSVHGPATSTTLAGALDENTGTLSYHLRMLERGGLIEDIPERSAGRERWWRGVPGLDIRRPPMDDVTAGERAVIAELDRLRGAEDLELARRFAAGQGGEGEEPEEGWLRGSRGLSHLTKEQLDAFHDDYLQLLAKYRHTPEDAAPGARPVHLRWFGIPAD
ncbi:ArsR/SmtB family transcription factor [Streptomyces sp. CMB-StM0423]|uniref:ArsR/SmtB family transcription factor n=1 Tax=Streptomyces sp. CMB-StM0423 TaxID=2059884 RepID=UPI000C715321|nr:helix-turn-helix domain-containing protein [Streptomyces sp. CMB-StM0423]AUH41808.1 transcriptional regulator [Streptomyces sp. CMB-StM0423]